MSAKTYDELQFQDDFLFCKIMESRPDICRELIELILDIEITKVVVQKQKVIEHISDKKGIRLDVYVRDAESTVYDIEMQTTVREELPKRSRYYQSMIDGELIVRGEKYTALKKSFVIFICMSDPFGAGRAVYTFKNLCIEDVSIRLEDDATRVFLNASSQDESVSDGLRDFFRLLNTGQGESSLSKEIQSEVTKSRNHTDWRNGYMFMWEIKEEGFVEGKAEGKTEANAKTIKNLLKKNWSVEEIAETTELDVNEVQRIIDEIVSQV